MYVIVSCDTALRSPVITQQERNNAWAWRTAAEKFEGDKTRCEGGSAEACDAAISSPAADANDRVRLRKLRGSGRGVSIPAGQVAGIVIAIAVALILLYPTLQHQRAKRRHPTGDTIPAGSKEVDAQETVPAPQEEAPFAGKAPWEPSAAAPSAKPEPMGASTEQPAPEEQSNPEPASASVQETAPVAASIELPTAPRQGTPWALHAKRSVKRSPWAAAPTETVDWMSHAAHAAQKPLTEQVASATSREALSAQREERRGRASAVQAKFSSLADDLVRRVVAIFAALKTERSQSHVPTNEDFALDRDIGRKAREPEIEPVISTAPHRKADEASARKSGRSSSQALPDAGLLTAAMVLGIIGGGIGFLLALFGYALVGVVGEMYSKGTEVALLQLFLIASPIASIVGAAIVRRKPTAGAILMGLSVFPLLRFFGFNLFTMLPVSLSGLGAALAFLAISQSRAKSS